MIIPHNEVSILGNVMITLLFFNTACEPRRLLCSDTQIPSSMDDGKRINVTETVYAASIYPP